MGTSTLLLVLVLAHTMATVLGEPSYYSYVDYRSPYTNSYTFYTNPFRQFYKTYSSPQYKYRARSYDYRPTAYDDDTVYVTDMYGNTRVSSARSLRGLLLLIFQNWTHNRFMVFILFTQSTLLH